MMKLKQRYVEAMPVVDTDQHSGRYHRCPICGWGGWSVWGHARKHWETHLAEERKALKEKQHGCK